VRRIREVLASGTPGETVRVQGWLRTARHAKEVTFLELNDGSSLAGLQLVAAPELSNYESEVKKLRTGCAVTASGTLVESPGKEQRVDHRALVSEQNARRGRRQHGGGAAGNENQHRFSGTSGALGDLERAHAGTNALFIGQRVRALYPLNRRVEVTVAMSAAGDGVRDPALELEARGTRHRPRGFSRGDQTNACISWEETRRHRLVQSCTNERFGRDGTDRRAQDLARVGPQLVEREVQ